jgi:hypothetical protein
MSLLLRLKITIPRPAIRPRAREGSSGHRSWAGRSSGWEGRYSAGPSGARAWGRVGRQRGPRGREQGSDAADPRRTIGVLRVDARRHLRRLSLEANSTDPDRFKGRQVRVPGVERGPVRDPFTLKTINGNQRCRVCHRVFRVKQMTQRRSNILRKIRQHEQSQWFASESMDGMPAFACVMGREIMTRQSPRHATAPHNRMGTAHVF